jgi:hypothetical protein
MFALGASVLYRKRAALLAPHQQPVAG